MFLGFNASLQCELSDRQQRILKPLSDGRSIWRLSAFTISFVLSGLVRIYLSRKSEGHLSDVKQFVTIMKRAKTWHDLAFWSESAMGRSQLQPLFSISLTLQLCFPLVVDICCCACKFLHGPKLSSTFYICLFPPPLLCQIDFSWLESIKLRLLSDCDVAHDPGQVSCCICQKAWGLQNHIESVTVCVLLLIFHVSAQHEGRKRAACPQAGWQATVRDHTHFI